MIKLLLCLFGILACFILGTVARVGIIGGELVRNNFERFSYQVSITAYVHGDGFYNCGGGIIDHKFILTAAHCVLNRDLSRGIFVTVGTTNRLNHGPPAERKAVKKIFWPKGYEDNSFSNDIAVLMLFSPVRLPHHRDWILHLPRNNRETYDSVIAEIAGYGGDQHDAQGLGTNDNRLRFAKVKVGSDWITNVPEEFLIADVIPHGRYRPRSVSLGDSGGPLVYNRTVIGVLILALDSKNEKHSRSATYARVSHYSNFIHNAIRNIETDDMATVEIVIPEAAPSSRK